MVITGGERAAAAIVGGLALAAAFPPLSAPWLAPLGLVAFFLAVGHWGVRAGSLTGFVFGLAFFGPTLWWLAQAIAPAAWAAIVALQAGWLALLGAGVVLVRRLPYWPIWAAALWTSVEGARSAVPWGGLPWGRVGYTAVETPWAASLALVGVAGTSALVALVGAILAATVEAMRERRPALVLTRPMLVSCTVASGLLLASTTVLQTGHADTESSRRSPTARVAVVQGEVPGTGTDVVSHHRQVTRTLLDETRRLAQLLGPEEPPPDLAVWPENATAVDPAADSTAREALLAAAEASQAPVLAGSVVDGVSPSTALNQGIVWTADGDQGRYTKQHLVPFGEYVPLRSLASRVSSRVSDIHRDMLPGPPSSPLRAGGLVLANALCFDVAYDDVLREQVAQGAQLAVVQTSNAMFLGTGQQEQQWMITRARAIELGRPIVVSSMNGISGAIASDGSVITRLPGVRAASKMVTVPLMTETTPAVRMGSWPARMVYVMAFVGILTAGIRASRRRGQ
ncbi:apolipoprotein N-acyltransferase [Nocardioides seonyuensis]|uniref:apolipoprotein N-acyltransferase n=1 Tax=Nocardioides seonyuensis TaxID=2518371 RepID=UPI00141E792D|nr:apolipoprotein N-acyltransferase [Nocardioides seonyuensis]